MSVIKFVSKGRLVLLASLMVTRCFADPIGLPEPGFHGEIVAEEGLKKVVISKISPENKKTNLVEIHVKKVTDSQYEISKKGVSILSDFNKFDVKVLRSGHNFLLELLLLDKTRPSQSRRILVDHGGLCQFSYIGKGAGGALDPAGGGLDPIPDGFMKKVREAAKKTALEAKKNK